MSGAEDYCNQPGGPYLGCPLTHVQMALGLLLWVAMVVGVILFIWLCLRALGRSGGGPYYKSVAYRLEYQRTRRVVMRAYGHRCAVCGSRDHVDVHHIQPRAKGGSNARENLIPLCHAHHQQAHRRRF